MTSAYVDIATNKICLEALNSDAAGYVVVWTLKNGEIINRETFQHIMKAFLLANEAKVDISIFEAE